MKKKKTGLIVWGSVSAGLVTLLTVATVLVNTTFSNILTTVLGGEKPVMKEGRETLYKSDYSSKEESKKAGDKLNQQIASEGSILLLNENNTLPLTEKNPKVSVFGKNSVNLVLGGSGSGGISNEDSVTLYDGLKEAGIEYNPKLKDFYDSSASGSGRSDSPALSEGSKTAPTLTIGETPISSYNEDLYSSFAGYSDAAIVVLSRIGGESFDLPRFQDTAHGGIKGNHYLQLDQNEYDLLDMVTSRFKKVIVVLNTLSTFQCDFLDEYNNIPSDPRIDALVWIGGPGSTGADALGKLLTGKENFSGRTTDITSKDFTLDPTYVDFGDNSQMNNGVPANAFREGNSEDTNYYVSYDEGIYTGYRYYETRGYEESKADGNVHWYENNVRFPFGYGLSYTEFSQTMTLSGSLASGSKVNVEVEVKNIGDKEGKDVVEIYGSAPYTKGGIEKSYVQLLDFAKTSLLKPGESEKISFSFDAYDLASYDYNDANSNGFKGYETEKGTYTFYAAKNSHVQDSGNVFSKADVTLDEDIRFENDPDTREKVENEYTFGENSDGLNADGTINYNDIQYRVKDVIITDTTGEEKTRKGMSRSDFKATFPTPNKEEDRLYKDGEKAALEDKTTNNSAIDTVTEMPKTGEDGSITMFDLVNASYDDPKWEKLLNRLTPQEMLTLVNNGAFNTAAIAKIKKNLTNDSDGPIGFVNFMPGMKEHYKGNTTFACEILIGATWNKDLAYQMGKIVGDNGVWGDVGGNYLPYTGWYAPAVNLHRSPFGGRDFEYYSEDPVLSGKLAVNVINGAKTKGVYTDLKHFVLNEQETARGGVATFTTEQALRELYLKPFEIAVKGKDNARYSLTATKDKVTYSGTLGVMSSFNRIGTRWTGGDYRLLHKILRTEWGFHGLVICDYKTDNSVMNSRQMLYAGNDLILASLPNLLWNDCDFNSAKDVTVLREACHNILYTVAHSNSMNVDIVSYRAPWWKTTIMIVDIVVGVLLIAWGVFVFVRYFRKGKTAETK